MADSRPNSEADEGDLGEAASSPKERTRTGSFTSEGNNADDMDVHEERGGEAEILRIEDLEVRDSITKPQDGGNDGDDDRDNHAETG
jgi:hypothetical protein